MQDRIAEPRAKEALTTLRIGRRVLIPAATLSALVERNTARGRLA